MVERAVDNRLTSDRNRVGQPNTEKANARDRVSALRGGRQAVQDEAPGHPSRAGDWPDRGLRRS
jgi:hypothetical protein